MVTMLMKGNQLENSNETKYNLLFNFSMVSFALGAISLAYLMFNEGFAGFFTDSLSLYWFMLFCSLGALLFWGWILANMLKDNGQNKKTLH